ncbi:MAG: MoxR family ATPase [Planctomycetes bacterium]|nr:MoxR family ATPase [Planctomycetota bacterium]
MIAELSQPRSQRLDDDFEHVDNLRKRLNHVIRGKSEAIEFVLVCLLSRGHLLLEDRPGLGKTTLAKSLVAALGGRYSRVQCTPDLLPTDITGFNILNQKTLEFEFRQGPVFSDVLLADEINRATPRTQSALLEAMAERQVTVDGHRFALSEQFFVIATQNPSDQHGTYPLPEAQLDRFAMKLQLGYPEKNDEIELLQADLRTEMAPRDDSPIVSREDLARLQQAVARTAVADSLQKYLVEFAAATRNHPQIGLGVSPRGVLIWQRAAQAHAFLSRRKYVVPEDIQRTAIPVLGVRIAADNDRTEGILRDLLDSVPLPEYRT